MNEVLYENNSNTWHYHSIGSYTNSGRQTSKSKPDIKKYLHITVKVFSS